MMRAGLRHGAHFVSRCRSDVPTSAAHPRGMGPRLQLRSTSAEDTPLPPPTPQARGLRRDDIECASPMPSGTFAACRRVVPAQLLARGGTCVPAARRSPRGQCPGCQPRAPSRCAACPEALRVWPSASLSRSPPHAPRSPARRAGEPRRPGEKGGFPRPPPARPGACLGLPRQDAGAELRDHLVLEEQGECEEDHVERHHRVPNSLEQQPAGQMDDDDHRCHHEEKEHDHDTEALRLDGHRLARVDDGRVDEPGHGQADEDVEDVGADG
mmetsp:Transcript_10253/g.30297  ORF Transcript_10253/g.30297 Transcript_10253/m.30297 type:complete len:269 (+) Transcript_10253:68-874(+)